MKLSKTLYTIQPPLNVCWYLRQNTNKKRRNVHLTCLNIHISFISKRQTALCRCGNWVIFYIINLIIWSLACGWGSRVSDLVWLTSISIRRLKCFTLKFARGKVSWKTRATRQQILRIYGYHWAIWAARATRMGTMWAFKRKIHFQALFMYK